jgi:hypothetical protein
MSWFCPAIWWRDSNMRLVFSVFTSRPSSLLALVKQPERKQVAAKRSVFWEITPCNPLNVSRRFEGTCRFHLPGIWANILGDHLPDTSVTAIQWLLQPWRWRQCFSAKRDVRRSTPEGSTVLSHHCEKLRCNRRRRICCGRRRYAVHMLMGLHNASDVRRPLCN